MLSIVYKTSPKFSSKWTIATTVDISLLRVWEFTLLQNILPIAVLGDFFFIDNVTINIVTWYYITMVVSRYIMSRYIMSRYIIVKQDWVMSRYFNTYFKTLHHDILTCTLKRVSKSCDSLRWKKYNIN